MAKASDIQAVLAGESEGAIVRGDALELVAGMAEGSVNLVFGSPPYEDSRTYGIDFRLRGEEWVRWMIPIVRASVRASVGLAAFVVNGKTRQFSYSATPELLIADLKRSGVILRKPPIFHRVGIPGSGGPDWVRDDYEKIICATRGGKLPWSDNTAMGHPPKWAPGGAMSHRVSDGARVNQWGHSVESGATVVEDGGRVRSRGRRPSHRTTKRFPANKRPHSKRRANGEMEEQSYAPPVLANPGNVISLKVGGGQMGHRLAHENEAPFPEDLAEFFIRSFCPPGGIVLDPFFGSGTTGAAALNAGRRFIGIDIRESQCELAARRIYGPLFVRKEAPNA